MILRSPKLSALSGLTHGFSTRLGGVSGGPYRTFNLGRDVDEPGAVEENRRRFRTQLGVAEVIQVDQVHGTEIVEEGNARGRRADGLFSVRPGIAVGIRTADCAPVLLSAADESGRARAVLALHAGWRGAVQGIVHRGIERLERAGFAPDRVWAAVGPTIGLEAFEVGPEVVDAARASLGGDEPRRRRGPRGRDHVDLRALVVEHLRRSGVPEAQIDEVGGCTHDEPALYFSHRRDAGKTGRHLSAVGLLA